MVFHATWLDGSIGIVVVCFAHFLAISLIITCTAFAIVRVFLMWPLLGHDSFFSRSQLFCFPCLRVTRFGDMTTVMPMEHAIARFTCYFLGTTLFVHVGSVVAETHAFFFGGRISSASPHSCLSGRGGLNFSASLTLRTFFSNSLRPHSL